MALISRWPDIQQKLKSVHKGPIDCSLEKEMLEDPDAFGFLCFMKMFPTHKYKVRESVTAFIVATVVS